MNACRLQELDELEPRLAPGSVMGDPATAVSVGGFVGEGTSGGSDWALATHLTIDGFYDELNPVDDLDPQGLRTIKLA